MTQNILSRDKIFSLLAAIAFVVGYWNLWRGGTTLSAITLALGYCVLVPLAIWTKALGTRDEALRTRPIPYLAATIVSLAVFALYFVTLDHSTAMWDTSEFITAAATFGLPHPPGNPLFVIVGHALAVLPVNISVAARINSMGAICGAIAAGTWFLLAYRVLRQGTGHEALGNNTIAYAGATCAALLAATAFTVWHQSLATEHVYTIALAGMAVVSWLMVLWADEPAGRRADVILVLVAYILALGYSNHMAGMLAAPAVGVAVLVRRPNTLRRWRLLAICAGVMVLGLTPFATQPIRAAYHPPINEGEPTGCRGQISLGCTFSKGTASAFAYNFNRDQYGKPPLDQRQACPPDSPYPCTLIESAGPQLGMWWLYFKWQWLRDAHNEHAGLQSLLAALFLVLGLFGGWVHFQRDRQSFWYFGALVFTTTLLLIYYLNFKYGASQSPDLQVQHEVRDRDYFYLWGFSAWGVWAAFGLVFVWESVAILVEGEKGEGRREKLAWVLASPVLALALVPLLANWHFASRAGQRDTRDFAADLLNSVEPYGVLVTVGDNDTFPLWYAQEVEHIRPDVVVAVTSLLNTDWYAREIIRRPVYTYDAAKGPAIYRDKRWLKPKGPPLALSLAEADSMPEYYQLPGPMQFNQGDLHAVIDPKKLEYGFLQRCDALVLRMIQDSWPMRPIYFSVSSGNYAEQLGLGHNMLQQGLAQKLFIPPAKASSDTVQIAGGGWLDVARSKALADSVFVGPKTVVAEGDWVDRPSVGIPYLYVVSDAELAEVLHTRGDDSAATRLFGVARRVASAVRLDNVLAAGNPFASPGPAGDSAPGVQLKANASDRPAGRGR